MKKLLVAAILAVALMGTTVAFADPGTQNPDFYTSLTEGGSFNHDFLPTSDIWIRLNIPTKDFSYTSFLFSAPVSGKYYSYEINYATNNGYWFNLTNAVLTDVTTNTPVSTTWGAISGQLGRWNMSAASNYFGSPTPVGQVANFDIVPEPISAGLFLLGGGALAVIRRKKVA
jgi:hypothetical protein